MFLFFFLQFVQASCSSALTYAESKQSFVRILHRTGRPTVFLSAWLRFIAVILLLQQRKSGMLQTSDWDPVGMVSMSWTLEIKPVTKREELLFSSLGVSFCVS